MINRKSLLLVICTFLLINTFAQNNSRTFTFAFMTDIHLLPEKNAVKGFRKAINKVNKLNPAFVITGGDMVMDVLGQSYGRADSLYNLYIGESKKFKMPVYNTIGNHEIYGIYKESKADKLDPEYGEKMFENRMGKSYYTFEHKGWKFFILNSIEVTDDSRYIGLIDSTQIVWIKEELKDTDPEQPIVISTHIPFFTVYMQKYYGSTEENGESLVVTNSKEIVDLFDNHNLKLVLQGHLHTVEDIYVDGVHFITGGAVSGHWWEGPEKSFEEGFMIIKVKENDFSWEYIDYGWEVKGEK